MFRNVSKSRRSKKVLDRPMLSLATKDREWQATTNDDTPFVDVAIRVLNVNGKDPQLVHNTLSRSVTVEQSSDEIVCLHKKACESRNTVPIDIPFITFTIAPST